MHLDKCEDHRDNLLGNYGVLAVVALGTEENLESEEYGSQASKN